MRDYRVLLKELRHFIISEAENEKYKLRLQWSRSLSERVVAGDAIAGLTVTNVMYDGRIHLRCSTNNSRFREGDFLVLHRGSPTDQNAIQVTLEEDDETELIVQIDRGDINLLQDYPIGWIADESMLDLSQYYLEAIDEVSDTERGRNIILPILTNDKQPALDYQFHEMAYQNGIKEGLNTSQAEALADGYATDLVHLIQGPPGTGKTYVLAHLVRMMIKDGLRVFVTALTHRAINNALDKIYSLDKRLPVCKIGRKERAKGLKVENHPEFFGSGFDELDSGYAIGATPFATRTKRLGNVEFDVVIFDEASQVTLPLALMGMLPAEKYIFIGDEHQLPPVTTTKSSELASYSIFKYLCDRGYETMLTTTYRLNHELILWPNRIFYNGKIKPDKRAANRKFKIHHPKSKWRPALDPDCSAIFIDLGHRNTTIRSQEEAEVVCEIVHDIIDAGLPSQEIGVVVPYRAQARLIRNRMRQLIGSRDVLKELVVDTVERMQGQEREVVLVSLTTSSAGFASNLAEFFFQPQRLNVSVTRPRTKLIIVGSRHVLEASSDDPEIQNSIEIFKELLSMCKRIDIQK